MSTRGGPLPTKLRARLAAIMKEKSEREVASAVGASRQALARALAGLPVYAGTVALIERYLESVR